MSSVRGCCRLSWLTGFVLAALPAVVMAQPQSRDRYDMPRQQMVDDYIVSEGVNNPKVIESMRTVPRHEFVRPDLKNMAYYDQALDIGYKQTISPPFIVAYMTEVLDPQLTDKVLEIGTGSGYQAAVLSSLVKDVYTIEIVEPLGKRAASVLQRLGYANVHPKVGDGYLGWPEHAPFDKIIVTCSPENVPQPLIDQLKEGGRMIIPLGERYQQVFYLFEKKEGKLTQQKLLPTLFVPMTGKMEELRQKKPDPAHPMLVNGSFEVDANEDQLADNWHYQRRSQLVDDAFAGKKAIFFENQEPGRMAHMLQAMAIDGAQVHKLKVSWAMKSADIQEGRAPQDVPAIILYFYDPQRLPVGRVVIGPWRTDEPQWTAHSEIIDVPPTAKEAIMQAGLGGATGKLWLDEMQVQPLK
ncbi:protein-L-isoaspartate(D-aspartate) O-methyltransferase [Planctomicrobium piriforme]|uniref:Protein-L-isoaspartate O-methyltransferase n=1 Tax=Planctomicrobium piriforme TaxID=1576369 RepID=A0A1I3EA39_9PLAN|nr:protein-L-isoaspartate(D-aspartate) O-methyltransferase [Planctomicrobium piriforme]SFH95561.1 protein-L-isoaspartate(D-aspartate) O-methyltransferase [Planctomicrobium piriforme]